MSNEFVTVKRADLEQALEALGEIAQNSEDKWQVDAAIKAASPIRAALEQDPALLQEPVYYRSPTGSGHYAYSRFSAALDHPEPLYTAPQPAQQPEAEKLLRQALEAMEVQGSEWVILERNAIAAIRKYFGEA